MGGFEWGIMAADGGSVPKSEVMLTVLLAVIGSGVITTSVTLWFGRRKTQAETSGIVADTYSQMLTDMRALMDGQNQRLELSLARIAKLERTEVTQRRRIAQLESALAQANIPIPVSDADGHDI